MAIVKLLHVLFVFIWIGSLLMLTRLLGYLAKESFVIQERMMKIVKRMYWFIDLPAMILTILFGLTLLLLKEIDWRAPWLHMKLTLAFLLIICDLLTGRLIAKRSHSLVQGRGYSYQVLHGLIGLIFLGILIAIYIFKAACTC